MKQQMPKGTSPDNDEKVAQKPPKTAAQDRSERATACNHALSAMLCSIHAPIARILLTGSNLGSRPAPEAE
jgi:hypothetical protein